MTLTEPAPGPAPAGSTQVAHPDGRVELASPAVADDPRFANGDLRPLPMARRTWTTYNFTALWVGMAHNIPAWGLAAGLVAVGMDWRQAVLCIALGNLLVLVPMLLNGHAGTKYGIPFPVFARAAFGVRGANLPALLRAGVACAWFGINTWIGGEGIYFLLGRLAGAGWRDAPALAGQPWTLWASFALFWAFQVVIIYRGMDTLRRFENWAAPFVIVVALILAVWIVNEAGGLGPILDQPSRLGWGPGFWAVFVPALMGMVGFWATLSLNIPDFTRFGGSQRAQLVGQSLGLPTTMTLFAVLAVVVTSGSQVVYGEAIWDPIQLAARLESTAGILLALATVLVASLSVNLAANLVGPAYDFSNLVPRLVSFRTGALITCVIGVLIQPWKLYSDPGVYIFTWLAFVGGVLGPVAAILIADYWVLRRTRLALADLYSATGAYAYRGGVNWRAVVAFVVAAVLSVGGSYSSTAADGTRSGPYPDAGLIPFLQPLADYGWAVGFAAAFVLYLALSRLPGLAPARAGTAGSEATQPLSPRGADA